MFTGIIEELGTIAHMDRRPDSIRLTIQAHKVLEGTQLGDSIAVNGVCLTVTDMTDSTFSADVMHETMRRSSFSTIKSGSQVNLERAMQVGGRLGGHIVSGHIDGIGHVARIATDGIARVITISIPKDMEPFIVEKGSITIDGISLTVVSVGSSQFSVSIIPIPWPIRRSWISIRALSSTWKRMSSGNMSIALPSVIRRRRLRA